jgi:hypothetical protein
MTRQAKVSAVSQPHETIERSFRVFLSSPSGLDTEKAIVGDEIRSLSQRQISLGHPGLSVKAWPHDIGAGNANYGQSVINRQAADFDILICVIGTRMGSRTPRASSGTEEEFDRAIEALLHGHKVQVLLFFSNMLVRPRDIDPNQLFLIHAFREKASRLGVLYQFYSDLDELRHLLRVSLLDAYEFLNQDLGGSRYLPNLATSEKAIETVVAGPTTFVLTDQANGPQWADYHVISLAPYWRQHVRITGIMTTRSTYFRFGFKYYDSREIPLSAGSVQTVGHNILFHIGKNTDNPSWFATSYKAGIRLGTNTPIPDTAEINSARFEINISAIENITFHLNDQQVYAERFPIDGIPNLAIMAWGDEHHFECQVNDFCVYVCPENPQ